jgi:NADPH2:quinone reductase
MKAMQITELTGPDTALALVDVPAPGGEHPFAPGVDGVLIEVHSAGVSFPDLLQTRGQYQDRPPLPFTPGCEVGGVVISAPSSSGLKRGEHVAAYCADGGFAEIALAPAHLTFATEGLINHDQAAALLLNYHTAYFALVTRGRLQGGETVLVHGAAGGLGTATIQVARGLGAETIAVVSSAEKAEVARRAGADHCVLSVAGWKDEVVEITGGGVDLIIDPVGGDRFTDSLRALKRAGRLVVVGFAAGEIPQIAANRILLRNIDVIGAYWGGWPVQDPALSLSINSEIRKLVRDGSVAPVVGARFPLIDAAAALRMIDSRTATGKVVLIVK